MFAFKTLNISHDAFPSYSIHFDNPSPTRGLYKRLKFKKDTLVELYVDNRETQDELANGVESVMKNYSIILPTFRLI
jgi:hypothetical protein